MLDQKLLGAARSIACRVASGLHPFYVLHCNIGSLVGVLCAQRMPFNSANRKRGDGVTAATMMSCLDVWSNRSWPAPCPSSFRPMDSGTSRYGICFSSCAITSYGIALELRFGANHVAASACVVRNQRGSLAVGDCGGSGGRP